MTTSRQTFVAVYDGHCAECDDDIFSGDEIAYLDDQVVCEGCWIDATGDDPDDDD